MKARGWMVRLFIEGGGNTRLFREIPVPAITKSAINPAFEIKLVLNFTLKADYVLKPINPTTLNRVFY